MLKTKTYKSLFYILGLLLLQGCLRLVSDEFPEIEQKPTVNSILIAGKSVSLHLSMAGQIDTSLIQVVHDAHVDLFVNENFTETLEYKGRGNYESETIIEPGKEYACIILVPGYDTISCSQFVPAITPMLTYEYFEVAGYDEEGRAYPGYKVTIPNRTDEKNYFELIRGIYYSDYPSGSIEIHYREYMYFIEDPVFLNEGVERGVFSDEIFENSTQTIQYNSFYNSKSCRDDDCFLSGNIEFLELRSVSEDYYRYTKQLVLYEKGRYSGFEGTLSSYPLYSNIENAYGIFVAYSYCQTDTIAPRHDL